MSSSGLKIDVQWSPSFPDRFITFGTDLSLYQVEEIIDGDVSPLMHQLSDTHCAKVMFTNSNLQYLKCVAWYPNRVYEYLLAIGLANGKTLLTNLGNSQEPSHLVDKELIPRYPRQCNTVAWNPVENNLLASGLEKAKTDHSILIWDVKKCALKSEGERRSIVNNSSDTNVTPTKPFIETGNSETVNSFQWFLPQPKTFVTGMSNRHLKIYDIRDASKAHLITATKAVYGTTVDPFFENRLASFSEGQIVIWDTRNFEKPITTIPEMRATTKIAWCPTRRNLLSAVAKDNSVLKLYDIQPTSSADEVELTSFERYLLPCGQQSISSFSWHPTDKKRMLLVTPAGNFTDFTIFERINISWAPTTKLVWTDGETVLKNMSDPKYFEGLLDISLKMKRRAIKDIDFEEEESTKDTKINRLWKWIEMVKTMQEEGAFAAWDKYFKFQGIRDIICAGKTFNGNGTNSKSEIINQMWPNLATASTKIYCNKDREFALQLCGWGCDRDGFLLSKLLESLEREKEFERAAAIAVFNFQIQKAIEILKKGALLEENNDLNRPVVDQNVNLNVVAMALSGYTVEKNALWRRMCNQLRHQLHHPYLKAIFSFLTSEEEGYADVLNERGLTIQDRVAFACWFLNDAKLSEFLNKLTIKMISRGDLDGILLTGLLSDGLDLLQQYVDTTGDIQTPCIIITHASPEAIIDDPHVRHWVESYRSLLDQWQLWHQRAKFDVLWNKSSKSFSYPLQHIYISCNYCGKSISSSMGTQAATVMLKGHSAMFANKTKMTSCPGCRKPLPRCAVCLINMGTASGTGILKQTDEASELRLTKFSSWFTWCQTCRHGGHAGHIIEWFKDHVECPVTGCFCKCMSLDSTS